MDLSIPPSVAYALAWFSILGGTWALFDRAETVASAHTRVAISTWLRNIDIAEALGNWPAQFAHVFDAVFGERHLSWRCFYRSSIASLCSVAIVALIWAAIRPNEFDAFAKPAPTFLAPLLVFVLIAVFSNVIPDYLSLLESRYVIRWMTTNRSVLQILFFLVVDFVATFIIFWIGMLISIGGYSLIFGIDPMWALKTAFLNVFKQLPVWASLSVGKEGRVTVGIFLYSTFFTSAWVWLYVVSSMVVKVVSYLGIGIKVLKKVLDVEEKPIRSLGFVAMFLVTIVFIIMPFIA